jgi:signal transduction histidine kinase
MFQQLEFLAVGLAVVVDTALLLALVERRNWRYAAMPIVLLAAAAWLLHAGAFADLLLVDTHAGWLGPARLASMTAMAAGLLLMPSALLHGSARLRRPELGRDVGPRLRYLLAYVPVALLVPIVSLLAASPSRDFLAITAPLWKPYGIWAALVDLISASAFYRLGRRLELPRARPFFTSMAVLQVVLAVVQSFALVFAMAAWPRWRPYFVLALMLGPSVLAIVFAYFVMRFNFMRLILERAIVYGAIMVGCLLVHRVAIRPIRTNVESNYGLDFGLLEGIVAVALIVAYSPLRRRAAEALRYLMGSPAGTLRTRTRQLAAQLSGLSGQSVPDLLEWFMAQMRTALEVDRASGWLFDGGGNLLCRAGTAESLEPAELVAAGMAMQRDDRVVWTSRELAAGPLAKIDTSGLVLAVRFEQPGLWGLLLLGPRSRNRDFGDEEANAVVLLAEQLGVALHNSVLQLDRLAAERRALESEKLATLGLLASSIAHEVKNPLSSIKTIASVMSEQLGPDSEHHEDLRLILGEIDRLAHTTAQLLSFVRPRADSQAPTSIADVLAGTLYVMRHLASQRQVKLESEVVQGCPRVQADENRVREVLFNLLSNSIEAAGAGGSVWVRCWAANGHVLAEVRDSGPGLPPEVQNRLFEPFVTTRPGGTGLGLYLVGRRMRELNGEIDCHSEPGRGTAFTLKLPIEISPDRT